MKNLNGLRFIAASYTIFFHYWSFPNSEFLSNFFLHGHISVPFFFLLSGFVLTYSYQDYPFKEKNKTKSYIINRFIRLAPIYYVAMLLAIPLLIIKQRTHPLPVLENLGFILSHLTMTQALTPFEKLINYWNVHSWSLSVEMFLYFCSPLLIIKTIKLSEKKLLWLLATLLVINSSVYFQAKQPFSFFNTVSTFFAPLYLPLFLNGVVLARILSLRNSALKSLSSAFFILSTFALVVSFSLNLEKSFYSPFNPFYQISFGLLILGSSFENPFNRFLGNRLFFFLGEVSYAMYILQAPIKTLAQQFLSKVLGYARSDGFLYCATIYLAIIVASIALSILFDKHAQKFLKKKLLYK